MKFFAIFWGLLTGISSILCLNVFLYDGSISQSIISGCLFIGSSIYLHALLLHIRD